MDRFELIREGLLERRPHWIFSIRNGGFWAPLGVRLGVRRGSRHSWVYLGNHEVSLFDHSMNNPGNSNLIELSVNSPEWTCFDLFDLRDPRFFDQLEEAICRNSVLFNQKPNLIAQAQDLLFP